MSAKIERPLSPHLQTYRVTLTMAMSIIHRATGIVMYFGTVILAWWLVALSAGSGGYGIVTTFLTSGIGRLMMFGYTWAIMHHLFSGIRYLVWDLGYGFKPSEREWLTWAALIAGIVCTILLWIVGYMIGGGR